MKIIKCKQQKCYKNCNNVKEEYQKSYAPTLTATFIPEGSTVEMSFALAKDGGYKLPRIAGEKQKVKFVHTDYKGETYTVFYEITNTARLMDIPIPSCNIKPPTKDVGLDNPPPTKDVVKKCGVFEAEELYFTSLMKKSVKLTNPATESIEGINNTIRVYAKYKITEDKGNNFYSNVTGELIAPSGKKINWTNDGSFRLDEIGNYILTYNANYNSNICEKGYKIITGDV